MTTEDGFSIRQHIGKMKTECLQKIFHVTLMSMVM